MKARLDTLFGRLFGVLFAAIVLALSLIHI